jgi:hypothetical protein
MRKLLILVFAALFPFLVLGWGLAVWYGLVWFGMDRNAAGALAMLSIASLACMFIAAGSLKD